MNFWKKRYPDDRMENTPGQSDEVARKQPELSDDSDSLPVATNNRPFSKTPRNDNKGNKSSSDDDDSSQDRKPPANPRIRITKPKISESLARTKRAEIHNIRAKRAQITARSKSAQIQGLKKNEKKPTKMMKEKNNQ